MIGAELLPLKSEDYSIFIKGIVQENWLLIEEQHKMQ